MSELLKFKSKHNKNTIDRVDNDEPAIFKTSETFKSKGYIGLMCKHCYRYWIKKISTKSEVSIENIKSRDQNDCSIYIEPNIDIKYWLDCECGESSNLIEIDANIVEVISILNKIGYETKYCCEGHHGFIMPYIQFKDCSIFEEKDKASNLRYWRLVEGNYNLSQVGAKLEVPDLSIPESVYLEELYDFVNSLDGIK